MHFLRQINLKLVVLVGLCACTLAGAAGSYYFYQKYNGIRNNPNAEASREAEDLVETVGKLMELPDGEIPTVAAIVDKNKLQDQPFFKNSQNGDKLLAYNTAMIAILYRPSTDKIINVAPITINPEQTPGTGNASNTQSNNAASLQPRLAYFNGTGTLGLSGATEQIVLQRYPNYRTTLLSNAAKSNYRETLVVDLSGNYSQEVSELAALLGGKVGGLPLGEAAPDADILIIVGQ